MRPSCAAALVFLTLVTGLNPVVSAIDASPIVVDGQFADWPERSVELTWPNHSGSPSAPCGWALATSNRLLFRMQLPREALLQQNSGVVLLVDLDLDPLTGEPEGDLGVDLRWDFGAREGRVFVLGLPLQVLQGGLGIRQAPTVSSTEFEISIDRQATAAGGPVFAANSIRVALGIPAPDSPKTLWISMPVTLTFLDEAQPPAPEQSLEREHPDDLRVLTWNVRFDGVFNRPEPFARILQAVDPDVILFQEVYNHSPEATRDLISEMMPGSTWYAQGVSGGAILSRMPQTGFGLTGGPKRGIWARLGAIGPNWPEGTVLINAHPPCCEDEAGRQEELDAAMAWLRNAQESGEIPAKTPLLIAGDMNLVGAASQVRTLVRGEIGDTGKYGAAFHPDWDGTPLVAVPPRHTSGREAYTWRSDRSAFSPGRLDYIVYSDSVLEQGNSFVLWTPDMSSAWLDRYGLQADDTLVASDHLPVVADFRLKP